MCDLFIPADILSLIINLLSINEHTKFFRLSKSIHSFMLNHYFKIHMTTYKVPVSYLHNNLQTLVLFNDKLIDDNILKNLSQLRHLKLPLNEKITDIGLGYIPLITNLILNYNKNITNEGLKYIPHVTSLNLEWNKNITNDGLKYIPLITNLDLSSNENITDLGLQYIPHITNLNLYYNKNITTVCHQFIPLINELVVDGHYYSFNITTTKICPTRNINW